MKNLTWQNPEQLFVAQELINKVKSKCCGIKVYYKGKTFEPIDRKSLTSIYKKYYADPIGYLLQDAKYAAIVKIKDEKGNILKHSKRAEPYNPIER